MAALLHSSVQRNRNFSWGHRGHREILSSEHLNYWTVNSPQLNGMSESQIREYHLPIVPGGDFEHLGNSLTSSTTVSIRNAIHNGLNYLGFCAGAFFAGNSPYNGLNLTSGSRFGFYAAEARGTRKAVAISTAGGQTLDEYWGGWPAAYRLGCGCASIPTEPLQSWRGIRERMG